MHLEASAFPWFNTWAGSPGFAPANGVNMTKSHAWTGMWTAAVTGLAMSVSPALASGPAPMPNVPYGPPPAANSVVDSLTYMNYMNMLPAGVQQAVFNAAQAPPPPPAPAAAAASIKSLPTKDGAKADPFVVLASMTAP